MEKRERGTRSLPQTFQISSLIPKMAESKFLILLLALSIHMCLVHGSCPNTHPCHCEVQGQKSIINCRGQGLKQVPVWTDISVTFYELTLARNEISSLNNASFQNLRIKRLDLSHNQITNIEDGAFGGLEPHLEELVLHVNNIRNFPVNALMNLTKLRLLHVKGFDMFTLPDDSMSTLVQLQNLKMESCRLHSLSSAAFSSIRDTLVDLSLPFNEFNMFPSEVTNQLINLRTLDIQHNSITELDEGSFPVAAKISRIDISNNQIYTIKPNAFAGVEQSLTHLVLKSNKLTDNQLLPLGVLVNLQELNLAYNSIGSIPPTSTVDMRSLRQFNLRANKIRAIAKETFAPLSSTLNTLELAENMISDIETGVFQDFVKLEVLTLDHQPLGDVLTHSAFQGLERNLYRLNLNNVGFSARNFESVNNLSQLKALSLSGNNIQTIPDMTFQRLNRLETLDLSNNTLNSISQRALFGMQNSLIELNMKENQLKTIPQCAFHKFQLMNRLKLGKNPLQCDCDLVWLRKWITRFENDTILILTIDWRCSSPASLENKLFRDVSVGELCDTTPTQPPCEEIELSTSQSPQPSTTSISPPISTPEDFHLIMNVTEISDVSALLSWVIQDTGILSFRIETVNRANGEDLTPVDLLANVRKHLLEGLTPETTYVSCITTMYRVRSRNTKTCMNFTTKEGAVVQESKRSNAGAIAGAVIGTLAFIALLIFLGFIFVRSRGAGGTWLSKLGFGNKDTKKPRPTGIPRMGYNSKRFSRPKGATASTTSSVLQNNQNLELEKKLAGFSPEERDRILNILTNTGGSTVSILSSGSSQRYAPDLPPRPQSLEGYLNPQSIKDDYNDPDAHIYAEIPGAEGGCYEMPRGSYRDSGFSTCSEKYEVYLEPSGGGAAAGPREECYI